MGTSLDFVVPLFVPGNRPERFQKAAAANPDAVIIDLEDAVPADAKDAARSHLRRDLGARCLLVRINAAGTPWHVADLEAVAALQPDAIVLPKAQDQAVLDIVAHAIGLRVPILALIETAAGLASARAIAAHPAVHRLAFGSIDYCADLGCAHTQEALLPARAEIVLASRLAGLVSPLDGVTMAIGSDEIVSGDARYARTLGFCGKLAIHPNQLAPIRAGFSPDADEIAWAEKILASGDGATVVDGAMVDEPVRIRARSILARRL